MTSNDLETQRRAAEACLKMRSECGIPYAPMIIQRTSDNLLRVIPADSARAKSLDVNTIIEVVDAPWNCWNCASIGRVRPAVPVLASIQGYLNRQDAKNLCAACQLLSQGQAVPADLLMASTEDYS